MVATDYVGLGTPGLMSYLNSVSTAHAVVDSVIAAHQMGLPLSPQWAIVGQSQGGGAAVNSARWATEFSAGSGLDYRGVVATGTPANIESVVKLGGPDLELPAQLGPAANSYTAYILAGFREARPDIDVNSVLSPAGIAAVDKAETVCKPDLDEELAAHDARRSSSPHRWPRCPGCPRRSTTTWAPPSAATTGRSSWARDCWTATCRAKSSLLLYDQLKANNQDVVLQDLPGRGPQRHRAGVAARFDAVSGRAVRRTDFAVIECRQCASGECSHDAHSARWWCGGTTIRGMAHSGDVRVRRLGRTAIGLRPGDGSASGLRR